MSEKTPLLAQPPSTIVGTAAPIDEPAIFQKNRNPQVLEVRNLHYEADIPPDWRTRVMTFDPFGKKFTTKQILKDVSLVAKPKQLLAILGSSGSGKTSLLDVLACRNAGGRIEGEILLNSKPFSQALIKELGAYVTQEDRFLPNLTVRETLTFVANMKFPSTISSEQKKERVETVLAELGLRLVADTVIGGESVKGISGGERRRVSIGCQLLLDPSILFLDEPTSGLDSFTAEYIVRTLVNLSRSDRTVITTIHSPRTDIFNLFDQILLLSQGEVVYFGAAKDMVSYFTKLGYSCPKYSNPCDYYMDISTIDFRSVEQTQKSKETVAYLVQRYGETIEGLYRRPTMPLFTGKGKLAKPLNSFQQFTYLYIRASVNLIKGYKALLQEGFEALAMGMVIGAIYWRIGNNQLSITDRYGLFFILSSLFPFMVILNTIAKFSKERLSFYNERQDGLYDLLPYFFSKTFSEAPFDAFFALVYGIPGYFMIQLNSSLDAFLTYLVIVVLSIYTSRSIALAISAGIVEFQRASFIGNLTYTIFLLPSGFLINLDTLSEWLRWVADISYLRMSFESFAINEFSGLNFTCNDVYNNPFQATCIETGEQALLFYSLGDNSVLDSCIYLFIIIFFFKLLQYLLLRFVNQRPA